MVGLFTVRHRRAHRRAGLTVVLFLIALTNLLFQYPAYGQETRPSADAARAGHFKDQVQPTLREFCLRCHNAATMESGIRLDRLDGGLPDSQLRLWQAVLKQVASGAMPPEDEKQPTASQRQALVGWVRESIAAARARPRDTHGTVRRLTVSQYRNTLSELLGLREDLTTVLPPDGVSKEGFRNNGRTLLLSPLLIESYFAIAEQALDLCIVDESSKPVIQNFQMDLGTAINPKPCPDKLILGANSQLLRNQDFVVRELTPARPFAYDPFSMRTAYRFIEGYRGNATVRGWREYDSIYHAVFACMRGTPGYPKGQPYQVVPAGLLLRPAIPSSEIFGTSSTYGPRANFKISLRELPSHGNFRVTVTAARYDDGLLLDKGEETRVATVVLDLSSPAKEITIKDAGVYQVDLYLRPSKKPGPVSLRLGNRSFSGVAQPARLQAKRTSDKDSGEAAEIGAAFILVRLEPGRLTALVENDGGQNIRRIGFSRLDPDSDAARRFAAFVNRAPLLGVQLGLRRDCGSTLNSVGEPQPVRSNSLAKFVFEGAINNYPSPDVEKDNVNYLAGIREIGVRSQYTDGRDMPRLLIRSVEFEGPYYSSWPPQTHRRIFVKSANRKRPEVYAGEIIRAFATRAFRRPVSDAETESLLAVWKQSFAQTHSFNQSVKDALLVVLTSPQFLFLIEKSNSPAAEDLDPFELASKLSYFLWNTAPDQRLRQLAADGELHAALDAEIDRMIADPRFREFAREFGSQWLSLEKFDVVKTDSKRFPTLTRDVKTELRKEPIRTLEYLIQQNLPLRNLVKSDFLIVNEVVAGYYGLGDRTESGLQFVRVRHNDQNLGGILTQASILAGLSNGREPNPVKRGAWLARKIIAEPPEDPPPNVPQIEDDDGTKLTLREKLQRHRDQKGCASCHAGIDPWGLPFESFTAGGLYRKTSADTSSTLPDNTEVRDLNELKDYLAKDRIDRVAFSFLSHLASYAVGRSLTYNEIAYLEEHSVELKSGGYPIRDMVRFVIKSDLFLKK